MKRAYQVICRSTDRRTWLKHRLNMVTASDTAAILGVSRFVTRDQVAEEKRTGVPAEDLSQNRFVWWGTEMEVPNMRAFGKLLGAPVRPLGLLLQSTATPLLGATLDGLLRVPRRLKTDLEWATSGNWHDRFLEELYEHEGETCVLEMKNISDSSRKYWNGDSPPEEYHVQVQQQLYVSGARTGVLCAKIGAADLRAFVIRYDEFYALTIVDEVHRFWREEVEGE